MMVVKGAIMDRVPVVALTGGQVVELYAASGDRLQKYDPICCVIDGSGVDVDLTAVVAGVLDLAVAIADTVQPGQVVGYILPEESARPRSVRRGFVAPEPEPEPEPVALPGYVPDGELLRALVEFAGLEELPTMSTRVTVYGAAYQARLFRQLRVYLREEGIECTGAELGRMMFSWLFSLSREGLRSWLEYSKSLERVGGFGSSHPRCPVRQLRRVVGGD